MDDHLAKPFQQEQLRAMLQRVMAPEPPPLTPPSTPPSIPPADPLIDAPA